MNATEPSEYLAPEAWRAKTGIPISKNLMYQAIREGTIPSIRIGWKILIPEDALEQMMAAQSRYSIALSALTTPKGVETRPGSELIPNPTTHRKGP